MSRKEVEICFKCNQKQRDQIRKKAKASGLKQGEYILQRALGQAPKETQLGAYLNLYRKLCDITNPSSELHRLRMRFQSKPYTLDRPRS